MGWSLGAETRTSDKGCGTVFLHIFFGEPPYHWQWRLTKEWVLQIFTDLGLQIWFWQGKSMFSPGHDLSSYSKTFSSKHWGIIQTKLRTWISFLLNFCWIGKNMIQFCCPPKHMVLRLYQMEKEEDKIKSGAVLGQIKCWYDSCHRNT